MKHPSKEYLSEHFTEGYEKMAETPTSFFKELRDTATSSHIPANDMDTTDITDAPQPPATANEQHSVPEPSNAPLDEPQSPTISHQEPEGAVTETVLQVEPNEEVSDHSNGHDTSTQGRQGEKKSLPIEKVVACVVTGVLSLFTIAMAYAAAASPQVIQHPVGPLTVGVILCVFDIIAFAWVLGMRYQVTTTGALVPIFFSLIGGVMVILLFTVFEAAKRFKFIEIDLGAVLISMGVFGGIGAGTTIGYLAFAKN